MANSEQAITIDVNTTQAQVAAENLNKELLVLRLGFGKLKAAVRDAVMPLGTVFVPVVQEAVWAATRLVKAVDKVVTALFGQGKAAKSTAKNQTALAKANDKVKRSLADFDEIDRLSADSGSAESAATATTGDTLTPQLQAVVDKILSLLQPLREIDFSSAVAAFGRLKEAVAPIQQTLFAGLEWAWHNLLVPLASWTCEAFLPAFLDTLAAALGVLNGVIVALQPVANWLWENFLQPIAQWTGEICIQALQWLTEKLEGVSQWVQNNQARVETFAVILGSIAAAWGLVNGAIGIWNTVSALATAVTTGFGVAMNALMSPITLVAVGIAAVIAAVVLLVKNWDKVKVSAIQVWESIKSAWGNAGSWLQSRIVDPLENGFKAMVNGIIGFFNGLISGAITAVNGITRAVNKLQINIPDWVPGLGGQTLGFQLQAVNAPQIPYLARGAVLPANKPFMAVLGDQKHGTNIEAPLDTIKQALAEVLGSRDSETVVQVNFGGDLAQLARVLKPAIDTETRRLGGSLARGGVF